MNLDVILYYANFLSLKERNIPVTDPCKFFFINDLPTSISTIVGTRMFFDPKDEYIEKSMQELDQIRNKYGISGVLSYIDNICYLKACGAVDAELMLNYSLKWASPSTKKKALTEYNQYLQNQHYYITIVDEDGNRKQTECTKYVAYCSPTGTNRKEP